MRDPQGGVIASLTISGPIYAPDGGAAQPGWLAARDALEREIAAAPDSFASPFSQTPIDEIVIHAPRRSDAKG